MFGFGKKIKKTFIPFILKYSKHKLPSLYSGLLYLINLKIFYKIKNKKKIILKFENNLDDINKHEFKVTSQNNEDGLIEYIFSKINNTKNFLEIGFHYTECNSLNLIKKGWNGTLIDSDNENCDQMRLFLKHYFPKKKINVINQFVNRTNLKDIIKNNQFDFLSIDIDGNDYWIIKDLNLDKVKVICCEYNPFFGSDISCTIEYNDKHSYKGDFYFGASLQAFTRVLKEKNFELIAVDSSGTNAFFINQDYINNFRILNPIKSFKNSGSHTKEEYFEITHNLKKRKKLVHLD